MAKKIIEITMGNLGEGVKTNSTAGRFLSKWARRALNELSLIKKIIIDLDSNEENNTNKEPYKWKIEEKSITVEKLLKFIKSTEKLKNLKNIPNSEIILYVKNSSTKKTILTNQYLSNFFLPEKDESDRCLRLICNVYNNTSAMRVNVYLPMRKEDGLDDFYKPLKEREKSPDNHFPIVIKKGMKDNVITKMIIEGIKKFNHEYSVNISGFSIRLFSKNNNNIILFSKENNTTSSKLDDFEKSTELELSSTILESESKDIQIQLFSPSNDWSILKKGEEDWIHYQTTISKIKI